MYTCIYIYICVCSQHTQIRGQDGAAYPEQKLPLQLLLTISLFFNGEFFFSVVMHFFVIRRFYVFFLEGGERAGDDLILTICRFRCHWVMLRSCIPTT